MKIGEKGWRPEKVHPLAALFPLLPPDDFDALAEDIKAHGLLHPIVIDKDGCLIDGRMRLAACDKVEVEPQYSRLNGADDVEALIWSANVKRRQMSKGQMAMIAAANFTALEPNADRGRFKDTGITKAAVAAGVSQARLSQALLVREHAPNLVTEVIDAKPGMSLDKAYEVALANKREKEWRENGITRLRAEDRDLAQRVDDREMTLDEARAVVEKRKTELAAAEAELAAAEANRRETMLRLSESAWQANIAWASENFVREVEERLADDDFRDELISRLRFEPDRIADVLRGATAFAKAISQIAKERNHV